MISRLGRVGSRTSFEELRVYQLAVGLSDEVWIVVSGWDWFAKDTIGKQLVRSIDSVGANIAEGCGRYTHQDNRRFVRIARGSLYESKHWLNRATTRNLLSPEQKRRFENQIDSLLPKLNAYLNSLTRKINNS